MTDKERAVIMAHTGYCMLTGDKFQIFHKYVEEIMGRPIMTHEIGFLSDTIKEKTKDDFIALCENDTSSDILDKIRAEIMKLQTYKMFHGEDTVYVERDDIIKIIDKCSGKARNNE